MSSDAEIDRVLSSWAEARSLPLQTEHRGEPVRSFELTDAAGGRYQLWVEPDGETGGWTVRAWDFDERDLALTTDRAHLREALDGALERMESWIDAGR